MVMMNIESFAPPLSSAVHPPLFARTQGEGETVVCLHSSTGSHAQWRELDAMLAGRCRVIAPDLHGHGRSPAWPVDAADELNVDARAVTALLDGAESRTAPGVHLVGHSYGGAVALQIALRAPQRVRSLTLYEPVAFGVIRQAAPDDTAFGEIAEIADSVEALVRRGELDGAARVFVNYWGGAGAWDSLGLAQRSAVLARIGTVPRHFAALFAATWRAPLLARLSIPTLLIHGAETRAPARRVADLLAASLPRVQRLEIAGAAHLGPITHAPTVAAAMRDHLETHGLHRVRSHADGA